MVHILPQFLAHSLGGAAGEQIAHDRGNRPHSGDSQHDGAIEQNLPDISARHSFIHYVRHKGWLKQVRKSFHGQKQGGDQEDSHMPLQIV